MLTTLLALTALFAVIPVTQIYMLRALQRNTSAEPKSRRKVVE